MKYIYTSNCCPKCVALKEKYNGEYIEYQERDAARIKAPEDEIDLEALVAASMNNMELPIEVDV